MIVPVPTLTGSEHETGVSNSHSTCWTSFTQGFNLAPFACVNKLLGPQADTGFSLLLTSWTFQILKGIVWDGELHDAEVIP